MLLGAALVALGVLAAALADRIRALTPRGAVPRAEIAPGTPTIDATAEPAPIKIRATRAETKIQHYNSSEDVVAALVAAGYKKAFAAEAAKSCSGSERATIEDWTRAALRRCAGEMS